MDGLGEETSTEGKLVGTTMYKIQKNTNHLLVEFEEDFDYNTLRMIIHHETMLPEYARMNDIWQISEHHALVSLDDLELIASDFQCRCPRNSSRKKTAIVVEQGLTEAIILLWIKKVETKVPFEFRVFHTLAEAEEWIGVAKSKVA